MQGINEGQFFSCSPHSSHLTDSPAGFKDNTDNKREALKVNEADTHSAMRLMVSLFKHLPPVYVHSDLNRAQQCFLKAGKLRKTELSHLSTFKTTQPLQKTYKCICNDKEQANGKTYRERERNRDCNILHYYLMSPSVLCCTTFLPTPTAINTG